MKIVVVNILPTYLYGLAKKNVFKDLLYINVFPRHLWDASSLRELTNYNKSAESN